MKSENKNNTLHSTDSKHSALNTLTTVIFYLAILFFIIGFNFSHNPAGNWYQQFMPNIGGRSITDITFTDSLTGYAVTGISSDTSFVLKTTNSGDNWSIIYSAGGFIMNSIHFFDQNTGYVGGTNLIRTTDGGSSWSLSSASLFLEDFYFISNDSGWFVKSNSLTGGVFFTSNGGASWQNQLNLGNQNPNHVYFYNASLGFVGKDNQYLRRTSNGGGNWTEISGAGGFLDMYFTDSLTGWKNNGLATVMQKSSNGGLNWVTQTIPFGGNIFASGIFEFSNINKDTIWGVGGIIQYGSSFKGMLYKTIDGGNNWLFQIPDTNIQIAQYNYVDFVNNPNGWAYRTSPTGIHTTSGGDTTFFVPVNQISSEAPKEFMLYQNYPNPFNPVTNFGFRIAHFGLVELKIFDITGKEIAVLIKDELSPGEYKTGWNASAFSSGIYFYSLIIDGKNIDTRKMALIK